VAAPRERHKTKHRAMNRAETSPSIDNYRWRADAADRMRTLLLAALVSAVAASWTAGVARVARPCRREAVAACPAPLHTMPRRVVRRRLDAVSPVEMCAAVGSISPSQGGFQSGYGIRNKARLLRRSWVIWTCCIWQGWKVLLVRRKYMSNPKSLEAAEARRKLAADLRDTLIRLGPTFIKARTRPASPNGRETCSFQCWEDVVGRRRLWLTPARGLQPVSVRHPLRQARASFSHLCRATPCSGRPAALHARGRFGA
jgi:hypothetical protein